MSTRVSTKPVRLRTYAADLERARGEKETTTPTATLAESDTKQATTVSTPTLQETAKAKAPTPMPIPAKTAAAPTPAPKQSAVVKQQPLERAVAPKAIKKPAKSAPTKIPAFHELQKKTAHPQKQTTLGSGDFDTTVIRETKKHSFNPFSAMVDSIISWFKGLKKHKKKNPVYTVADAAHRKGVIQEATSKSGTSFTADSESLKERIRRRQAEQREAEKHETFWSPNTDAGYALLEGPDTISEPEPAPVQHVTIEHKKMTGVYTPPPIVVPTEEPEPPAMPEPTPTPAPTQPEPPAPLPEVTMPEPRQVAPHTPPVPVNRSARQPLLQNTDTNTLTLLVMGGVVACLALVFSGVLLYQSLTATDDTPTPVRVVSEPIIPTAQLHPIVISATEVDQLPAILTEQVAAASAGLVEFPVTGPDGNEVSPSYLFSLLQFDTLPALRQSINTLHFVSVNNSQPAMLFTFTDKEAVYGALLDWEQNMSHDLSALYPQPNTDQPHFIDQTINGIDARLLTSDANAVLVYGFVNDHTVLITPSRADFTQIVNLMKQ